MSVANLLSPNQLDIYAKKFHGSIDIIGPLIITDTTDSTSTTTGSIITAGGIGIAKKIFIGTGLQFDGVNQSTLNGYINHSNDINISFTGPLAYNTTYRYIKIGNICTLSVTGQFDLSPTGTGSWVSGLLPFSLIPLKTSVFMVATQSNSLYDIGIVTLDSIFGRLTIQPTPDPGSGFTGPGNIGFLSFEITYITVV